MIDPYRRQCGRAWRANHESQWQGEEDSETQKYLLFSPDSTVGEEVPENSISGPARESRTCS